MVDEKKVDDKEFYNPKLKKALEENSVDVTDEKVIVAPKKGFEWFWAILIIFVGLLLMAFVGWTYYHDGYVKGVATCPSNVSLNGSIYDDGFSAGVGYGVNMSIQRMLYYAQNCSTVRINYSGNVYGFVDATCLIPINRTVG